MCTTNNLPKITVTEIIAGLSASSLLISEGMHSGWSIPTPNHPSRTNVMWLQAIFYLGEVVTSPLTFYSIDKIGRKKTILLTAVASSVPWLILIFKPQTPLLFFSRFLAGSASNASMISVPIYISEIANSEARNLLLGVVMSMHTFGIFLVFTLMTFNSSYVPSAVAIFVLVVLLTVVYFVPESPYYLILMGEENLARESLDELRRRKNCDEEIEEIKSTVSQLDRQQCKTDKIRELVMTRSNRKALIITSFLSAGLQFSGFEAILMNTNDILVRTHPNNLKPSTAAILFSLSLLFGHILCLSLVDRLGKKILFLVSAIASGIFLLALAIYFNLTSLKVNLLSVEWLSTFFVVAYGTSFAFGFVSLTEPFPAELFSTRVRAMGTTFVQSFQSFFAMVMILLFNVSLERVDIFVIFYFFAVVMFLCAVFVLFFVEETNRKSLYQIQNMMKS